MIQNHYWIVALSLLVVEVVVVVVRCVEGDFAGCAGRVTEVLSGVG